jgi:hypothetical protein
MDPNLETNPPESGTPPETPAVDDTDTMAAMDRGIEAATETPAETVEPTVPQAGEEGAAPEAVKPEGEAPPEVAKTPEELAAEAKGAEEIKPDAETEKEISDLKLKDKSADRFRELSSEVKAAAPVMSALKEAGIPVEQLPSALQAASNHREWVQQVVDTGASPERYADSLQLLSLVTKAQNGDHASAEAALQQLAPLCAEIAKLTGREVPGLFDPLEAHADLLAEVQAGDMSKKAALEVVRARQLAANTQQQTTQRQQTEQATLAAQAGVNALIAIDNEFKALDKDYARKRPILDGIVQSIRETLPPEKWGEATRKAYARIALPAPAPFPQQTVAVGHVPLRPTGARANLQPEFDNPMDAMDAGIAAAGLA